MQIANDNDSVADTRYKYLQDTDTSGATYGDINCCQASNLIDTFLADAAFLIFIEWAWQLRLPLHSQTKLQSELKSKSKLNSTSLLLVLFTSFVF